MQASEDGHPDRATGNQNDSIVLSGDLDIAALPDLVQTLAAINGPAILDFSEVRYMDSTALDELARYARRIRPARAKLTGLQPLSLRILKMVKFDDIFDLRAGA